MKQVRRIDVQAMDEEESSTVQELAVEMAADMAGLLQQHADAPPSAIEKAKKDAKTQNLCVYNLLRAWDHQLQLAGLSLQMFVAAPGHTALLKPGEVRYMCPLLPGDYTIPSGCKWERACIKNVSTSAKRFEMQHDIGHSPQPCLVFDLDESSINLAAIQFLQNSLHCRVLHMRDPLHRCWNDLKQSFKECDLWSDVLEKNFVLGLQHAPWKSAAFFRQLQESAEQHVKEANMNNPLMAALEEQLEADVRDIIGGASSSSTDRHALWQRLQTSMALSRQSSRCSLSRWFEWVSRWREFDKQYSCYLYYYCLILFYSGKVNSVLDLPIWSERLGALVVQAKSDLRDKQKKQSMAEEKAAAETTAAGTPQRKAMNSVHLAALILGNAGAQRRGKIMLEVAAPVEYAFNREVKAVSQPDTMRETVIKYVAEGYSAVLIDILGVLKDADALSRMRFTMHAQNKNFYQHQVQQQSTSSSSSSTTNPSQWQAAVEIHETDAEDAEMAELLFKVVITTVRCRALSMSVYTSSPPGQFCLLMAGESQRQLVGEALACQKKIGRFFADVRRCSGSTMKSGCCSMRSDGCRMWPCGRSFFLRGPNGDGTKGDTKLRNFWCTFDVLNFLRGEACSQMMTC